MEQRKEIPYNNKTTVVIDEIEYRGQEHEVRNQIENHRKTKILSFQYQLNSSHDLINQLLHEYYYHIEVFYNEARELDNDKHTFLEIVNWVVARRACHMESV